jgi:8-oxo-dGTP diphosphatase
MKKKKNKSRRPPIEAAGGIVMRGRVRPLFAVVQLSRQKTWVLPKGKLNRDETALAAAKREAIEETGHDVEVHEFLGSLVYQSAGRPKTVRFWRMQASGRPVAKLMRDVRAVRWLSLAQATARLTHEREKLFLEKVGRKLARQTSLPKRKVRNSATPRPKKVTVRMRAVAGSAKPSNDAKREDVPAPEVTAATVFHSLTAGRKPPALVRKIWTLLRR